MQAKTWGFDQHTRIAGFFNPELRIHGKKVVFFGYWETINELKPNQVLFAQLEAWARACGATHIYGPINCTTYGNYRIQIGKRQDRIPFWGEPYNPPYYEHLLKRCGYTLHQKYLSIFGNEHHLNAYASAVPSQREALHNINIRPTPLTPDLWMERQEEIHSIFQDLWQYNFGFVPIDLHTFKTFFSRKTAEQLDPNCSVALLDSSNRIAGYLAVYPNYGPVAAQGLSHQKTTEISYAKIFPQLSKPALLLKTGCVHPKYRNNRLFTALSLIASEKAKEEGYSFPIGCLIRADNHPLKMAAFANRIDPRAEHTEQEYGLFMKQL
jgi:hypothetical protein